MLQKVVREGRPNRIGFSWAGQYVSRIDRTIFNNTEYLFIFKSKMEQSKQIISSFGQDKSLTQSILALNKRECVLCTSIPDGLVVYDQDGSRTVTDSPQIGMAFPIPSNHQQPGVL